MSYGTTCEFFSGHSCIEKLMKFSKTRVDVSILHKPLLPSCRAGDLGHPIISNREDSFFMAVSPENKTRVFFAGFRCPYS